MDFALSAWIVPIDVIGKFSFGVTYINLWFLRKKHCKHSLLIKCALPKQIQQIYNIYNICKRWELSGTNLTSIHMFQMGKRMTWPHVSLLSFYSLKSFYEQFFSKHSFGCFLTKMLMMMRDCIFYSWLGNCCDPSVAGVCTATQPEMPRDKKRGKGGRYLLKKYNKSSIEYNTTEGIFFIRSTTKRGHRRYPL